MVVVTGILLVLVISGGECKNTDSKVAFVMKGNGAGNGLLSYGLWSLYEFDAAVR